MSGRRADGGRTENERANNARRKVPYERRTVSNAPLRERFLDFSDLTAPTVARRLNWYDTNGKADGRRVRRLLGIDRCWPGPYKRETIRPSTALKLGAALGMDPHEVGV